jgi:lysophospholipase L1-like esterase
MRVAPRVIVSWALTAAALGATMAAGQRPTALVREVRMEGRQALAGFHQALAALAAGEQSKVRVLHYGDSNVAADLWTKVTREALHARYGDGGPGYVVPGFGSRWNGRITLRHGDAWKARRKGFARDFGPLDGRWGLAGVAAEGRGQGAWVELRTGALRAGAALEVHALGQPAGGSLAVRIDGGAPEVLPTHRGTHGLVQGRWELGAGEHTVHLRVQDGRPVRLLGVVVENAGSGVVYDVLGINGHRASAILEWDEALLRAQLARRTPDLVILSYGGNEALDPQLGMDRYERKLEQAVARIRSLAPSATLLLVGPLPMCPERPRVAQVAAVQRRVAQRAAAAYWDASRLAGNGASLCSWRHQQPALISGDGLHLSKHGYTLVGQTFTKSLLAPSAGR